MQLAWLAPALSFIAFGVVGLFGRYLPGKGSFLSILAIAAGFVVFWAALFGYLGQDQEQVLFSRIWLELGGSQMTWGMIIDPLSLLMLGIVTLVALLVQVYSIGYMHGQERFGWYFAAHSLFVAAMLTLVLADNLVLIYIAWELVGLGSYLLIGFWYERRSATEAAKKAFVTTRIGDVGMLIGILILFKATGTFELHAIFQAVESGAVANSTLTWAAILLFTGAMGKSAQFPLHVWLPDAMEGPTPVSALIHAATMVAAGVYLVARTFPLFEAAPSAQMVVAVIGIITAGMAATMALVMTDMKRVLAYSTVSHLGFMMLALGAGSVPAAMFHLLAHAFSKALLFLGAGSVMHAMHDETDMRKMGGLRKKMPITGITFTIGALSLAGIPPLSGFFSKDEMLLAISEGLNPLFLAATFAIVFLSALYMARLLFVVFYGAPSHEAEHAHESPSVMTLPLVILAAGAVVAGFLALQVGGYEGFGSFITHGEHHFEVNIVLMAAGVAVALAGFGLGYAVYMRKAISTERVIVRFGSLHKLLVNKYYMDSIYQRLINHIVPNTETTRVVISRFIATFDRTVVNDVGVNGAGKTVRFAGFRARYLESGMVYNYALAMALGAMVVALFWWLVIPRIG
ncbi:MAG: NADH-quinone oxidoreductase subunit L [Chloroflexi bacterium]|nr:NADH-quinone oxidoreductase subunit L [Chloroflexota bacterium]